MLWLIVILLAWLVLRLELAIREQRAWRDFVMKYGRDALRDGAMVEANRRKGSHGRRKTD